MKRCQNCKAGLRRLVWTLTVRASGDRVELCSACCDDALTEEKDIGVLLFDVSAVPL